MISAEHMNLRGFIANHPEFLVYWMVRLCAGLSYQIFIIVISWRIYNHTKNVILLGAVGLTQFLPAILLVLLTGQIADRFDRRQILIFCQLSISACMFYVTLQSERTDGSCFASEIFVMLSIIGSLKAFEFPAMQAILPTLVAVNQYSRAAAIASSASEIAIVVGPLVGGLLYEIDITLVHGVASGFYTLACACTLLIKRRSVGKLAKKLSFNDLLQGYHFLRNSPIAWRVLTLDLIAILFGSVTALLPVFAREILAVGSQELGWLRAAPALGAGSMLMWLAYKPVKENGYSTMCMCVFCYGLSIVLFSASTSIWLSLVLLVLSGAFEAVSVVVRTSLIQFNTPDSIRGRVGAIHSIFINSAVQLGQFESGILAYFTGVRATVAIGGVCAAMAAIVWIRHGKVDSQGSY